MKISRSENTITEPIILISHDLI